tara:strand:+ start:22033 stop:22221 length:189 start_codon:yes stop_codon:yes gene_type:complete
MIDDGLLGAVVGLGIAGIGLGIIGKMVNDVNKTKYCSKCNKTVSLPHNHKGKAQFLTPSFNF